MITGEWHEDSQKLLQVTAVIDAVQVIFFAIYGWFTEVRVATLECSPHWEQQYCSTYATDAALRVLMWTGVVALTLAAFYTAYGISLRNRAQNGAPEHPFELAVVSILHAYFVAAFAVLLWQRSMPWLLVSCCFALLQVRIYAFPAP